MSSIKYGIINVNVKCRCYYKTYRADLPHHDVFEPGTVQGTAARGTRVQVEPQLLDGVSKYIGCNQTWNKHKQLKPNMIVSIKKPNMIKGIYNPNTMTSI